MAEQTEEQQSQPVRIGASDQTHAGGAYLVGGIVVDANGAPRIGWTIDEATGVVVPPADGKKKAGG